MSGSLNIQCANILSGCYCPFMSYLFLEFSKVHNFGEIHGIDMGLTLLLTLTDGIQTSKFKIHTQVEKTFIVLDFCLILLYTYMYQ